MTWAEVDTLVTNSIFSVIGSVNNLVLLEPDELQDELRRLQLLRLVQKLIHHLHELVIICAEKLIICAVNDNVLRVALLGRIDFEAKLAASYADLVSG